MNDEDSPDEHDGVLTLAPVPLATGDLHQDEHGTMHRVHRVDVVLTLENGSQHIVPLKRQHGAWWAPPEPWPGASR